MGCWAPRLVCTGVHTLAPAAPCAPIVSASVTPLGVVLAAEAGARGPRGPLGVDFLARLRGRLPGAAFERACIPPPEGRPCVSLVS